MFKLTAITAFAVGALLIALLSLETSRPGGPLNQSEAVVRIPQRRIWQLAGEAHLRLLVDASHKLGSTGSKILHGTAGEQCVACKQDELRHGSGSAR